MEKAIKTIQVNHGYIQLDLSKPERIRAFSRRIQVAGKRAEKMGKRIRSCSVKGSRCD